MKSGREPYARIVVGIVTLAILPPLGIAWLGPDDWFTNLQNWQSGIGAFWGALFGLGAILIGALFNADLNRKRDDRLYERDARSLAAGLHAEVQAARVTAVAFIHSVPITTGYIDQVLADDKSDKESRISGIDVLPIFALPIYKANSDRLGKLGITIASQVAALFATMAAYERMANPPAGFTLEEMSETLKQNAVALEQRLPELEAAADVLQVFAEEGEAAAMEVVQKVNADLARRFTKSES